MTTQKSTHRTIPADGDGFGMLEQAPRFRWQPPQISDISTNLSEGGTWANKTENQATGQGLKHGSLS